MAAIVSVVMPTYERPALMAEALESALAQTFGDFVILIGDNSDSEDIKDLVAKYNDPRIQYKKNPDGYDAQRNWVELAKSATTKYLASLHDDDVWEPNFLERTVAVMEAEPEVQMAFCDYSIIDSSSQVLDGFTDKVTAWHHRDELNEGLIKSDLEEGIRLAVVWNSPQPAYAALLRTEFVQAVEFTDEMSPLYDIWLSYQMAIQQVPIYYITERLTRYRVHSGSLTSASFASAEDKFFEYVVANHSDLAVVDELQDHWADLRWARATKMMIEKDGKKVSQEEFAQAVSGLHGSKKLAAWLGAHSGLVWNGIRWMRGSKGAPAN